MQRRQKWTENDDEVLTQLVQTYKGGRIEWSEVAASMRQMGLKKNRKQVSERWQNILSPGLDNSSLSQEEVVRLFELQKECKNKWRKIASHFKGKTDNLIKNSFFAITRKALRLASRIAEQNHSTQWVNSLKPKVIADFLDRNFEVGSPESQPPFDCQEISIRRVVIFLSSRKWDPEESTFTPVTKQLMRSFILSLDDMNSQYLSLQPPKLSKKIAKRNPKGGCQLKDRIEKVPKLSIRAERPKLVVETEPFVLNTALSVARKTPSPGQPSFQFLNLKTPVSGCEINFEECFTRPVEREKVVFGEEGPIGFDLPPEETSQRQPSPTPLSRSNLIDSLGQNPAELSKIFDTQTSLKFTPPNASHPFTFRKLRTAEKEKAAENRRSLPSLPKQNFL